jgi:ATP-dependent DNA helicase RecG
MESQHSEFKTTWRDEYLKWICGFANANGGSIIIGMDDDGTIVGVEDYKRLLEDIPNKARNTMGSRLAYYCWKPTIKNT